MLKTLMRTGKIILNLFTVLRFQICHAATMVRRLARSGIQGIHQSVVAQAEGTAA